MGFYSIYVICTKCKKKFLTKKIHGTKIKQTLKQENVCSKCEQEQSKKDKEKNQR